MPLAKYVALHYNDLSFPFRRYQIGKVYRGERAQRGRFREFYQADIDIIGQFGVGFYSAFMVADKVTVISKAYGSDEAWQWESSGADGYDLEPAERETAGTDIILHIKPDTDDERYGEFLESWKLQELVRKYSDYIRFPITMFREKSRQKPKPEEVSDRPARRDWAMPLKVDSQSPPQCTGNCCPPAVADRANTTASPSPRSSTSRSKTALL